MLKHILCKPWFKLFFSFLIGSYSLSAFATQYLLPNPGNDLIGGIKYASASTTDTPTTIAQRFDLGLNAIVEANAGSTERMLGSTHLRIPTAHILPPLPHKGIIINLPEMRMYYYPSGSDSVMTFPIGIGKIGKSIPMRNTTITRKVVNPTWIPGPDIRAYNEEQGIELPYAMGPGPDNPLGPYAIYLNIPTYLIHSTIFPESIGRRASFGCIRMNENDIKQFFPLVTPGTSVAIINMPYKVGWHGNKLYLEAHAPLAEWNDSFNATLDGVVATVQSALPKGKMTMVDWQLVAHLAEHPDGVPHEIGTKVER